MQWHFALLLSCFTDFGFFTIIISPSFHQFCTLLFALTIFVLLFAKTVQFCFILPISSLFCVLFVISISNLRNFHYFLCLSMILCCFLFCFTIFVTISTVLFYYCTVLYCFIGILSAANQFRKANPTMYVKSVVMCRCNILCNLET